VFLGGNGYWEIGSSDPDATSNEKVGVVERVRNMRR